MKLAAAILVAVLARPVDAGPYCGMLSTLAPVDEATLPVAPTIAMHVEHAYYNGTQQRSAKPPRFHATIDSKRVAITTRDKRTGDGLVRFIKIGSKRTGKLQIWMVDPYSKETVEMGSYTISNDWTAPTTASATVTRGTDTRLGPYRWLGHHATVRVDVPAIAFTLRWRRDAKDRWRTETLAAAINDDTVHEPFGRAPHWGASEARIGQRMCGMIETVPVPALEQGIDVEVTATLPNGRVIAISGLDRLQVPKADRER